jgi:hypothetical protein
LVQIRKLEDWCIWFLRITLCLGARYHLIRLTYVLKNAHSLGSPGLLPEGIPLFCFLSASLNSCLYLIGDRTNYWWIFGMDINNFIEVAMLFVLCAFSLSNNLVVLQIEIVYNYGREDND